MLPSSLFPLLTALLSAFIAQVLKIPVHYYKTGKWDLSQAISSGGFPSSHSSTVTALSIAIGLQDGFNSSLFAVTAVFSCIVMYDACHVRYYTGKNIELTQELIKDLQHTGWFELDSPVYTEKLKTVLGHKLVEVFGGFILGLLIPFVMAPIFLA
ncbi:divergent PAP2 family protein [Allobaculum mucilyticum]|uniref:divergent PAP2 family protein n=1 Tax=Allobaculum mucilyticum TaxID=2834459 RepID=UPI001E332B8E|nr:divergent PAP2 family protein [Allobaculum mucilyticum]UNT95942.1 divergent PAP2 family protein [Allobaculum mucilyticum]